MEKIIALLVLTAMPVFAAPADGVFKEANALYQEGKFADAAQKYQSLLQDGSSLWVVEYNVGNAFFRQGQIGQAILHYERAFRLNSHHKDLIYNLGLASAKAGDPRIPESGLLALAWKLYYLPSVNALTLLGSLLFIALAIYAGMVIGGRRVLPVEMLWTILGLGMGVALWLAPRIYEVGHAKGVVVAPVAEVRSGPSITYPTNFTVPEGHRVLILRTQESIQGWLQIGVPREGLRGWVPEQSVSVI